MTHKEHLFLLLAEEAGELSKAAIKVLRFGLDGKEPGQEYTNEERIMQEFHGVLTAFELLESDGIFRVDIDTTKVDDSIAKKLKFMEYSLAELRSDFINRINSIKRGEINK